MSPFQSGAVFPPVDRYCVVRSVVEVVMRGCFRFSLPAVCSLPADCNPTMFDLTARTRKNRGRFVCFASAFFADFACTRNRIGCART